jgi:UDP-2,3-diacylglucosamine pyrophosphatase LpxH
MSARAMAHDLLVVSDVHLTDGREPAAGEAHLAPELERFLAAHERHPQRGRHYRLILNGDLFDFLHVRIEPGEALPFALKRSERARGPGTSAAKSVWRLKRILAANARTLEAFGRFLSAGNEVVVLPGNHDLELYWPEVRAELTRALRAHTDDAGMTRFRVDPWFYYEPGLIYVEHGSQFDADNRAFRWLAAEVPDEPGELELPAGSIINRYFTHRLGMGPFVGDTSQSALGYALWMARQFGFAKYFVLFTWYLSFCWRVVTWAGRRTPAVARADALHAERRSALEVAHGMPAGTLAAIDESAPPPVMATRWRMLDRTMLPRVVTGIASVLGAALILALGGWSTGTGLGAAATLVVPLAFLTAVRHTYTGVADRYYPAAAETIRRRLGVRHVVFGHQHIARAEVADEGDARYVNLGCWIEGAGFERIPLHYFEVRRDDGGSTTAELKRWPARPRPATSEVSAVRGTAQAA